MTADSRRLARLLEVSSAITYSLDTQEVMDAIIRQVSDALRAEACSLLLKQEDSDTLYFHSASGRAGDAVKQFTLRLGEGAAGLVAQTGEPLLVVHAADDVRLAQDIAERVGVPVRSLICAPLRIGDQVIGSIEVLNPRDRPAFDGDDLAMLGAITNTIALALRNASRFGRLAHEADGLRDALGMQSVIVGNTESMQQLFRVVHRIGPTNVTVLITGETGTGKGLLARFVHEHSRRRTEMFVEVNCAAIPESLIESELFGHERGAFTGATYPRMGKFELANGGTLYLDEIGDLSIQAQAKLLRAVEEQRLERVGSNDTICTDVRIIATTNKNLEDAVEAGVFRADLFYRLYQLPLHLPPLRERMEDIPALAEHYLAQFCEQFAHVPMTLDDAALCALLSHPWPGNVRELKNAMKRTVLLVEGPVVMPEHLPFGAAEDVQRSSAFTPASLNDVERAHIVATLTKTGGVKKAAASILGISRSTLDRKIQQYDIPLPGR